jgi:hypothetical protein
MHVCMHACMCISAHIQNKNVESACMFVQHSIKIICKVCMYDVCMMYVAYDVCIYVLYYPNNSII